MKKLLAVLLIMTCVIGLSACGEVVPESTSPTDVTPDVDVIVDDTGAGIKTDTSVMDMSANIGVSFEVKDVTSMGMVLVVKQSGGEPTGSLKTGGFYTVDRLDGSEWVELPYVNEDSSSAWSSDTYWLEMDGQIEIVLDWSLIYGELSAGTYRLGKDIVDFRGSGDFDPSMHYIEFVIE